MHAQNSFLNNAQYKFICMVHATCSESAKRIMGSYNNRAKRNMSNYLTQEGWIHNSSEDHFTFNDQQPEIVTHNPIQIITSLVQ